MKYFIYKNEGLKEVTSSQYETWIKTHGEQYHLPEIYVPFENKMISTGGCYYGVVNNDAEVLPFILVYYEDSSDKTDVSFFHTFEELKQAYNDVVRSITSQMGLN